MKLIDLKRPKLSEKETKDSMGVPGDQNRYPYGLELHFDTEEVEKIEELQDVEAGATLKLIAEVTVTGVRVSEHQGDKKKSHSVDLQLTKVAIVNEDDFDAGFEEG